MQVAVNGRKVTTTNLEHLAKNIDALPGVHRSRGRIGLQEHTGEVRFRNIEIDELPGELTPPPFLNAADWQGLPHWTIKDGTIQGTLAEKLDHHTFLCSRKTYRDFELQFQVKGVRRWRRRTPPYASAPIPMEGTRGSATA